MDQFIRAYEWAKSNDFTHEQVHYATILALKILDKQCKMDGVNYRLFMHVYNGMRDKKNSPLNLRVHKLIEEARGGELIDIDPAFSEAITNLRTTMMQSMQKPLMKAYKNLVWDALES